MTDKKMPLNGIELRAELVKRGAKTCTSYQDLPTTFVYCVTYNENIFAFGKAGQRNRIRSFFPGSSGSAVHTKAFVVAAASHIFGACEITVLETKNSTDARSIEKELEGIGYPKLWISTAPGKDLFEVSQVLWALLKKKHQDLAIPPTLEQMMPLVFDNGDVLKSILRRFEVEGTVLNVILGNFFSRSDQEAAVKHDSHTLTLNQTDTFEITMAQIVAAQRLLAKAPKVGKTKKFYFETSHKNFVLEVEKPAISDKLQQILNYCKGTNKFVFTKGKQTNTQNKIQYSINPYIGSVYLVERKRGYNRSSDNYFERQQINHAS